MIAEQVERERRRKITESKLAVTELHEHAKEMKQTVQLIEQSADPMATRTVAKAAALFQTNRTYVNQASKLKQTAPETFAKVRSGQITMTQATPANGHASRLKLMTCWR